MATTTDELMDGFQKVLLSEADLDRSFHVHKELLRQLQDQIFFAVNRPLSTATTPYHSQKPPVSPPSPISPAFAHSPTFHSTTPSRRHTLARSFTSESSEPRPLSDSPLCLLEFWGRKVTSNAVDGRISMLSTTSNGTSERRTLSNLFSLQAGDTVKGDRFHFLVIHPNSRIRMFWDLISANAIFYDVITVPLMVFGYDQFPLARMVGLCLSIFWVLDLCLSFFVGFQREDGGVEMRLKTICRRYLHTWFPLDIVLILADAVVYLVESLDGSGDTEAIRLSRTLRAARFARFLRVLRLTRVLKLLSKMEDWCDVMLAASAMAFFNIVKLILGVAIFAHFIACAWYYVGSSAERGWVSRLVTTGTGDDDFYAYISAYHWTMSQFTPAPNDLHPQTVEERSFAVVVLFVGFIIFSSLLGSTTALISQARTKAVAKVKTTDSLRRFFVENHVNLDLASRIMRTCRGDLKGRRRVKENDLIMLRSLPLSVQIELRYQVFSPHLCMAPFFGALAQAHPLVVPDLCHSAMQEVAVNLNEELFHFGTRGTHVYYVLNGNFMYYPGPIALSSIEPPPHKVIGETSTLAEAALWVHWDHRGQLTASSPSDVVKIDADVFRRSVRKTSAFIWLRDYAAMFANLGNAPEADPELDDVWSPFKSIDDVTETMDSLAARPSGKVGQDTSSRSVSKRRPDPDLEPSELAKSERSSDLSEGEMFDLPFDRIELPERAVAEVRI